MAISISALLNAYSYNDYGTGTYTTSSFTIPNNCILVAHVAALVADGDTDPSSSITISDSIGGSWTSRATYGNADSWAVGARLFTEAFTTGGNATITVWANGAYIYVYNVMVVALTGYDTSSPVGGIASNGNLGTSGSQSITLSSTPASSSIVVAFMWLDAESISITESSGWTERYETLQTYLGAHCQSRSGLTSTTVPWSDISGTSISKVGAAAIEIKGADEYVAAGNPYYAYAQQ